MSISRQQRRAMQRKMQGLTNDQAERMIVALRDAREAKYRAARKMAPGIADEVLQKVKTEWEPEIRARVIAETLIMIMAFEHIDHHHTGKWLRKWLHEFNRFGDAVNEEGSGIDGLKRILAEECGLDLAEEFRNFEEEEQQKKLG